jgi:Putative peptidoglycan binding domain
MMALGDPQVSQGSSGEDVKRLQQLLAVQRFYVGPMDGMFGAKTRAGLIQFQETKGLAPDGIAGEQTWKALREGPYIMMPAMGPMIPDAPQKFGVSPLSLSSVGIFAAIAGTLFFSGFFKK